MTLVLPRIDGHRVKQLSRVDHDRGDHAIARDTYLLWRTVGTAHAAWKTPLRPLVKGGTEFPTLLPDHQVRHSTVQCVQRYRGRAGPPPCDFEPRVAEPWRSSSAARLFRDVCPGGRGSTPGGQCGSRPTPARSRRQSGEPLRVSFLSCLLAFLLQYSSCCPARALQRLCLRASDWEVDAPR